jgi:6-pyruvoyltetrahydropterin/6-carboxytetrahydropterin synthase
MRLEIDGWMAGLKFSACHFLPGHERCGRLHGHTYAVSVRLEGATNDMGYIADFYDIKNILKGIIEELDHRVLVPARNRKVKVRRDKGSIRVTVGSKEYQFPEEDVALLDVPAVTAEQLAIYILERAVPLISKTGMLDELSVGLFEGVGQGAWTSRKV